MVMSWNDPCMVQATRTGDWPAELLAEYTERFEPLVRVATMMLGSRSEAEEVVQEAFIATARNWSNVNDVRPYVRRAVVNGSNGVLRRRRTSERFDPDPPPADTPDQLIDLRDLLLTLPSRQRQVLILRFVEDLADDDIATLLGCRRATVRSLAARGLALIRKELS